MKFLMYLLIFILIIFYFILLPYLKYRTKKNKIDNLFLPLYTIIIKKLTQHSTFFVALQLFCFLYVMAFIPFSFYYYVVPLIL